MAATKFLLAHLQEKTVPDPAQHADDRNALESILRCIPGFRGYVEKEYRRESDQLARTWIADRLQRGKRGLEELSQALVDVVQLDELPVIDRVRNRLDGLISRIRSAVHGYSGFFDFVTVNESLLDEVYDYEMLLFGEVETLASKLEQAPRRTGDVAAFATQLLVGIESLEKKWQHRVDLLKGLADRPE